MRSPGFVLENSPNGPTLVVTSSWTREAASALERGEANGLVLNYARGFREPNLEFLESWRIQRLNLLSREISDLGPIGRLANSLEDISVQASPAAELDLGLLPHARVVAGEWALIRNTLGELNVLEQLTTWRFDESDLHSIGGHYSLVRLTVKEAPYLHSLSGLAALEDLSALGIFLAPGLRDITDVSDISALRELEFEKCPGIASIDDVEDLIGLSFLGVSDCQEIDSLRPLELLNDLEVLHAWGTTRIVDGDLSPLARLPKLKEIRMRDRPAYSPRVEELKAQLSRR